MKRYKFSDIAYNITEKKMPVPGDEKLYIGLEHLDSGSLQVSRWGGDIELKGEKLIMRKGDVLFGRRNTYLRRAAIAPHDGIFSAHGMIFRPKTDAVDPSFFPFFIASDYFMDEAIRISVGSLSPTVNWGTLKNLEFNLPDISEQQQYAKLLAAFERTKEAYKKLISATDDLVKSQFIERFSGDDFLKEPLKNNVEEMFIGPFGSALKNDCFVDQESGYCMVYEQKHAIQKTMDVPTRYVSERKYQELKRFTVLPGDIIVSCRGTVGEIYAIPDDAPMGIMHPSIMKVRLKKDKYDKKFFVFALEQYMQDHARETNGTSIKMAVSASALEKELFIVPKLEEQRQFVSFVEQSDKSKFAAKQALEEVTDAQKALMKKIFE